MIADASEAARLIPQGITVAVTGGGVWGVLKLVRAFQRDFFTDYRSELGELRARLDRLGDESTGHAAATRRCEERESVLRRALIAAGIPVPDGDDD